MSEIAPKVFLEKSSFQSLSLFFRFQTFSSCFVLVDENTVRHCYPVVLKILPEHQVVQISSGEKHKTLETCETVWKKLTESNAGRDALLINLGGGVIGDLGGFAAGCFKRGIRFINIPTTLLAMVDANVGAKTGLDFLGFKNQIGLFNEPEGVFVSTGFLRTLPEKELRSGFAEVIKHYLIADKQSFDKLNNQHPALNTLSWDEIVEKNIRIKSTIVFQDPKEQNIRKALNFGHTIGHALESLFLKNENQKLLHGESVAAGMLAESYISKEMKLVSSKELESIVRIIFHYYDLPGLSQADYKTLLGFMKQDKKNKGTEIQFTLLNGIGNYSINQSVKEDIITASLEYYNRVLNEYSESKPSQ